MSFLVNPYRFGTTPSFSFNNALLFDGVDDFVSTGTTITAAGVWTFSTWFKFNSLLSMIASYSATNRYWAYFPSATAIRVRGGANADFTVPTMSSGVWYHLMITCDATNTKLYLNGVESSSGSLNISTPIMRPDRIGVNNPSTLYWDGVLDEFIFETGTVYTSTDAINLYNSGNGVASDSIITNPDLYYKFDESGTATTALDSSGNGFNGTLNNFPTSGMWIPH